MIATTKKILIIGKFDKVLVGWGEGQNDKKTKHTYSGKSLAVTTLHQERRVVSDDQPLQVRRHLYAVLCVRNSDISLKNETQMRLSQFDLTLRLQKKSGLVAIDNKK